MHQLADVLEAHLDALLKQWVAQVGASLAPGRTTAELTDYMPVFLRQVLVALREPARAASSSPLHGHSEAGREHGAQRFRLGFDLEAVIREYGLLLHLILDLVETTGAAVSIGGVRRLNDLFTNAVAEATGEYTRRLASTPQTSMVRENQRLRAQLETTLFSMGDGVLATDAAGLITLINPAAEALTGWSAGEALGQPVEAVLTLVDATTRAPIANPFTPVLRGEASARLGDQILLVRRDGAALAFADSLAAIRDGSEVIVGAVLVFRDETELRRKDAELRTFRAVVDASTDFISFGKPGGRPEYVNPAGLRMVGLPSLDAARALEVADYFTPEARAATLAELIPEIRAGRSFVGETELRHFETGAAIPVSQSAFAVTDASGQPLVLATVIRDRRDQQRADAEREQLLVEARAARAEADLQRERLAGVFTQAPVAVGILRGASDTVVLANDAMCRIWGFPHATLIGRPIFDFLVDARTQGFPALLASVRSTGAPFVGREATVTVPRPDGGSEGIVINFVYQPLREADGSVNDILVVATDVTVEVQERRAAEAISAEFEAMFNSMTDGVYLGDATGVRRANGPGLAMLGVERVEDLHLPMASARARLRTRLASTGGELPRDQTNFTRALGGETFTEEYLIWHPIQQQELRVRSLATPVRIGGAVTRALIINTDITEQHRALEALQQSEEGFRTLAEAIPQQVWTSTPSGALDFVNQRVLDYFEATRDQVLGAGWQAVIHPEDLPGSIDRWTHAITTGTEYEVEFRLRRGDGTYRWHLGRAVPARDGRGQILKWFGTNTDVDDANKVREELAARTTFEQHLLGIVSHDLRNPLAAILLSANTLLQMEDQSERVTRVARRVHSAAERSARMISDLLDFTQARLGGGIKLERRPADIYVLVSATLEEVETTHPDRTLSLVRAGDTRGTWDADRIVQVVMNLVTNALKYSTPGTPVTVGATGHEGRVELSVHNHCPPIPPERLGSLFQPLQRATDAIDRKTRSVGLGLYIVESIVRAHGGTVGVVSTAEAGTTFTVRLPREPLA